MTDLKRVDCIGVDNVFEGCIEIPPSKNHAYIYKGFKKIPKQTTRDYMEEVRKQITKEIKEQEYEIEKECTWCYIDLYFYMPDKRIRDSHNSIEVLMDTLEGTLFVNDYYIMPRVQSVELDRENPRLEFKIQGIPF